MNLWPQPVQQLLDPQAENANELLNESPEKNSELRKDVLIGHLLRLISGGQNNSNAPLPAHALPAVASELCRADLIPRYNCDSTEIVFCKI